MVAVEPLGECQWSSCRAWQIGTYIAARPIIPLTMTLTRRFICRSFTTKMGSRPKVQSATEFSAETQYVKYMINDADRQVPWWLGSKSHQKDIGLHWNSTSSVYAAPTNAATAMMKRMIQMWRGTIVMRSKNSPTEILKMDVEIV